MKINSTTSSRSVSRTSRTSGASKGGFAPETAHAEVSAPGGVAGTSPIASVEALIALQAESQIDDRTRKATRRAGSLLDILDTIRLGLIDGGIPQSSLHRLLGALGETREQVADPALNAILEQVEIRAQVELAKLEVAVRHNITSL